MKIDANIVRRIQDVDTRYNRYKGTFSRFIESARFLLGDRSPIAGLKLDASPEGDVLEARFIGIVVRFVLIVRYDDAGALQGQVLCARQIPKLTKAKDLLGSFIFKTNGETDFEVEAGADSIDMTFQGPEIVVHFMNLAITQQFPLIEEKFIEV